MLNLVALIAAYYMHYYGTGNAGNWKLVIVDVFLQNEQTSRRGLAESKIGLYPLH